MTALAILCGPGAGKLPAQMRLGLVMPFENRTHDASLDWIGESFAETLTGDLASPRMPMIDRRERASAFDQLGMPASSILSDATIYKVADVLDASYVVLGHYQLNNTTFIATAQVLDVDSPSLSKSFTESGPFGTLLDIESGLAWQLHQFLRPNYPLSKQEYLAERSAPRLEAVENYVRGLLANDKSSQVRYFRAAQRIDGMFTKPAFELGMIYFHDKDYATSILWLSKLRRSDADYLEANYFLGLAYLYQQKYEHSAAAFRVVELELPLNEVYNNLGVALEREDRPGALQYFEKAAESSPADPDYQFNLGFALWKRDQFPEACEHFRKSLDSATSQVTRAVYAECLKKIGRPEEAARQQQYLIGSQIPAPVKFENLERPKDAYDGASFRQLRRLVQLQEELKHTKLSAREHAEAHLEAAQEAFATGAERQAIDELAVAIGLDPENPRPYLELARVHLKAGRLDDAVKSCDRALAQDQSPEGYLLLARIYLAQGKTEEAQAQINDVLRLDPANAAALSLQDEVSGSLAAH